MFQRIRQWVGLSRQEVRDTYFIAGQEHAEDLLNKYPEWMAINQIIKEVSELSSDDYYGIGMLNHLDYYRDLQKGHIKLISPQRGN